jgi:hypothetical protein
MTSKQGIVISYSEDRGPGALVVTVSPSHRDEIFKPKKICRVFRLVLSGPPWVAPVDDEKNRKALAETVEHVSEAARKACHALAAANGKTKAEADYPEIEVHAPTHLLMVIGEEADVDLVAQIISGVGGLPMGSAKPELPKEQRETPAPNR